MSRKWIGLVALVAGMADLIRRSVGPAIRLELRLRDGRARILCDPTELESALRVLGERPADREHRVVRGERCPIVEFHARAELEAPARGLDLLPR